MASVMATSDLFSFGFWFLLLSSNVQVMFEFAVFAIFFDLFVYLCSTVDVLYLNTSYVARFDI
jgi:hypothetical protein